MNLRLIFTRRWLLTTLLAVAAVGVMIRLGIWQLDRLAQRREFNARVKEQLNQEVLVLDGECDECDYDRMEFRPVEVSGNYEYDAEVVLLNRNRQGNLGVDLLTPLRIVNSNLYVLVNRGWVPQEDYLGNRLEMYHPTGEILVRGYLRKTESRPTFGGVPDATLVPGQERLDQWNVVNVERIGSESGLEMLPVYIQELRDATDFEPPIPDELDLDLTEGSHLGYALQWFTFAAILLIGYPIYVRKNETAPRSLED